MNGSVVGYHLDRMDGIYTADLGIVTGKSTGNQLKVQQIAAISDALSLTAYFNWSPSKNPILQDIKLTKNYLRNEGNYHRVELEMQIHQ